MGDHQSRDAAFGVWQRWTGMDRGRTANLPQAASIANRHPGLCSVRNAKESVEQRISIISVADEPGGKGTEAGSAQAGMDCVNGSFEGIRGTTLCESRWAYDLSENKLCRDRNGCPNRFPLWQRHIRAFFRWREAGASRFC